MPPLPGEPGYEAEEEADTQGAAWKRMHAMFREAGYEERPRRIAYASEVVQRPIGSTRELSQEEVSRVIDALSDTLAGVREEATSVSHEESGDAETSAESADDPLAGGSVSLAVFRARIAGEGIPRSLVEDVGRDLFPGASLGSLDHEELQTLLEAVLERNEEEGGIDF